MLTLPGPESVNVGTKTPKVSVVVAVWVPDVPVIVNVYCPTGTELLALSVSTLLDDVGFGFHSAVTPLGRPEIEKVTLPVKPYCAFTET
jgi:hypothetical protein